MTLGPVRVMGAGVKVMLYVEEVWYYTMGCLDKTTVYLEWFVLLIVPCSALG